MKRPSGDQRGDHIPSEPGSAEIWFVFRSTTWMDSSPAVSFPPAPKASDAPSGDQDGSPSPYFPLSLLVTCRIGGWGRDSCRVSEDAGKPVSKSAFGVGERSHSNRPASAKGFRRRGASSSGDLAPRQLSGISVHSQEVPRFQLGKSARICCWDAPPDSHSGIS